MLGSDTPVRQRGRQKTAGRLGRPTRCHGSMTAQPNSDDSDLEAPERVKNLLAKLTELDIWMDADGLARNLDGVSEEQAGEAIAQLQTGEIAEPGDTIITSPGPDGAEFYQYEPANGGAQQADG